MKRRCLFLDRDGVINVKPPDGQYVCDWDNFVFIPEIIDWIKLFKTLQFLVVVVTNQRGVARGLLSQSQLTTIHERMRAALADQGAALDDVFYCPHEKDACDCRKPRPGMILAAREKWNIDLADSLFIGDSKSDQDLARNCGIRYVSVRNGRIEGIFN